MTEAYIYDAIRTPRGKGKNTGSLHQITPIKLASKTLKKLKERNNLDTKLIDDVVLGFVSLDYGEKLSAAGEDERSIIILAGGDLDSNDESTVNQITQSAQNQQNAAQSMGSSSVMGVSNQFFSADTQIFSDMSGITVETLEQNAEMNEISVETQSEQMQMEIENNLLSTGNPVVGVTIIPVETMTVQPEQEAPRKSLAEVISEQVAQQKRENSNKVASGQTAAIASLQSSVDLGSYYESNLTDGDFYNVNYIVYENKLDDNARLIYNLSKSNHGTIRKMIRSQYE